MEGHEESVVVDVKLTYAASRAPFSPFVCSASSARRIQAAERPAAAAANHREADVQAAEDLQLLGRLSAPPPSVFIS